MNTTTETLRPDRFDRIQALTREYAKFSRSAGGLGNVLGGLLGAGIWLIGAYADPPLAARASLWLALPAWLWAKTWLRHHYYQRHGAAWEQMGTTAVNIERLSQGALAGVACVMLGICIFLAVASPAKMTGVPLLNKLALVAAPLAALILHRRINTPFEAAVAVNLLVQAVMLTTGTPTVWSNRISTLLWAVLLIVIGLWEQVRFSGVERQLAGLRGER